MFEKMIEKPKITLMFLLILIVVGILTVFQLPQREVPELSFDTGTVSTVYPGGTPEEVERQVTEPIESEIEGINGISQVHSVSTSGFSNIVIELVDGVGSKEVFGEIQQAINSAQQTLPEEAKESSFQKGFSYGGLSSYHLLADDRETLYEQRELIHSWQQEIESLFDIDQTLVKGFPDQHFSIDVKSEELFRRGLQIPDVIEAIDEELNTIPLGVQSESDKNFQLSLSSLKDLEEVSSIFVANDSQGDSIYVKDIADVGIAQDTPEDIITYENTTAISFTVFAEEGADIPKVHDRVHERMLMLAEDLPQDVELDLFYTQKTIVDEIFGDLSLAFSLAVLSVIVVTLLGLNISTAVIVALAIPSSVLIGLIPLPYLNVDLNQISIIGMIIAIGILVDDAIVVGDNIRNKYRQGLSPLEGAKKGSKEVRVSIITSTLTIVFTFLPLVFISGGNGDFIRALPSVLITTILASTIVALSIVPLFLIWRQKKRMKKKESTLNQSKEGLIGNQLDNLSNWYSDKILRRVVKHPWKVAVAGFILTTGFYALIPFIPVEFFPSTDRDEVTVDVRLPSGTTIEETDDTLEEMRKFILSQDEHVYETTLYTGDGLPPLFGESLSNSGVNTGNILLRVKREEQTAEDTIDRWTEPLQEKFPQAEVELKTIEAGPPVGAPIAIKVQGPELNKLMDVSNELKERIAELPESGTVRDDMGPLRPTIKYEPIREKLEKHGITMQQVSEQISLKTDGMPLMTMRNGEEDIPLQLTLDQVKTNERVDLSDLVIPSEKSAGDEDALSFVSLDTLLDVEETKEIPQVLREDGERTITVRVFPRSEENENLEAAIEGIVAGTSSAIGTDYTISLGGETEQRSDFILELFTLFLVVIFLIYAVMAVQFYSLTLPILVMSTVYIAGAGAVIGLFLTQTGLGFMALMGIVSLAGIVVRNSIVLLEFIKQQRAAGIGIEESVIEAGRLRLRPVLLTAVTAIGALTPVALSGDVLFVPLAISIISGLMFSAILTVVIVPAVYTAFATKFSK
ncbi:efflux RND transporter permease subunit [Texcoconibacillus texcoconensis]|uniref:Multidrug efflux pump subunit AcrB n=1 Tax=Texcoconibacillus texcoconensis TaxID=1095777 RepID=A0A840QHY0_9BACI|nr:efflux RND transporter permease subunit [Texcoconibacillus texcoconensis]MBB5171944.1 multidrug efflux pump subunit AcrB [Texcoconibacillus texcoconensis]